MPARFIIILAFGLLMMMTGIVASNLSHFRMWKSLNRDHTDENKIPYVWRWDGSKEIIRTYRSTEPNGKLYRNLVIGYVLIPVGLITAALGFLTLP